MILIISYYLGNLISLEMLVIINYQDQIENENGRQIECLIWMRKHLWGCNICVVDVFSRFLLFC